MKRLVVLWTIAVVLAALPAGAAVRRFAVIAGNDLGHGPDAPLRYAASDAAKVAGVLRDIGDFPPADIVVHDAGVTEPAYAFALSRLPGTDLRNTPIGVFRNVSRPSYDNLVQSQLDAAKAKATGTPEEQLAGLLTGGDAWTII